MSSRKKRDNSQDFDESTVRSNLVSPEKQPNETLFQFFKKKTKFNLDKSYKNNLQSNKRYNSTQPHDRESTNTNLNFLRKLNETMSPKKKSGPTINNYLSPPKPNLSFTIDTKDKSFESGLNATWTSKGADDRRYSSINERKTPKNDALNNTMDNLRSSAKKSDSNPLKNSMRKVQFSDNNYLTDKSEVRESDNAYADDEDMGINTFDTSSRISQIASVQKRLINLGTQLEESVDNIRHFSSNSLRKYERLIKYIESNEYFDSSSLKNITCECKVTNLSLTKALNAAPNAPSILKLVKEFDELHRKERESQIEEAKNSIRHAMNLQKSSLEKKNFELEVEIEKIRHELIIHQENSRNRDNEKKVEKVQKSYEVEELLNHNSQLQYRIDKLQKENAALRDEYLEVQKRLERETEYLKAELNKALEVVELPLARNPKREERSSSALKDRGNSFAKDSRDDKEDSVIKYKRGETPKRSEDKAGENVRFLKLEINDLKSEKLILVRENETLLQRLTDQIMMERDMKRIISKNEDLTHKLKLKKGECDNLWKAMRELKAQMMKVSRLNDMMAILRKYTLEEKARQKFESKYN